MELPEDEHSPEVESQVPEHEQKDVIESEHREIPQESESPTVGEDVANIATEEHPLETIDVHSDALPLENEDQVDTAAEIMDDEPMAANDEEVETDDVDVKEPEEELVDEKSEIGMHLDCYELTSSGT